MAKSFRFSLIFILIVVSLFILIYFFKFAHQIVKLSHGKVLKWKAVEVGIPDDKLRTM